MEDLALMVRFRGYALSCLIGGVLFAIAILDINPIAKFLIAGVWLGFQFAIAQLVFTVAAASEHLANIRQHTRAVGAALLDRYGNQENVMNTLAELDFSSRVRVSLGEAGFVAGGVLTATIITYSIFGIGFVASIFYSNEIRLWMFGAS